MSEFKPKVWMTCPLCNKPSPFPDPDYREWVGLTDEEVEASKPTLSNDAVVWELAVEWAEAKLKELNT